MMANNRAWMACVEKDWPEVNGVTLRMKDAAGEQATKIRGSVRAMLTRVLTSDDIASRKKRAISRSLKPSY